MSRVLENIQKKCCGECLFTKNKIVSDDRKKDILLECKEKNNHFICHKASIKGLNVICHGFYKQCTNPAINTLFEKAGLVSFVDIE